MFAFIQHRIFSTVALDHLMQQQGSSLPQMILQDEELANKLAPENFRQHCYQIMRDVDTALSRRSELIEEQQRKAELAAKDAELQQLKQQMARILKHQQQQNAIQNTPQPQNITHNALQTNGQTDADMGLKGDQNSTN